MTATNQVQQISVDFRRDEIQVFRNGGRVNWYPSTAARLDTLRSFDGATGYRFHEYFYGWMRSMWVRRSSS